MPTPAPICLSIILCDQVIEDKRTHNKSFINCFNQIWTTEVPVFHPLMYIVVSLTECQGPQRLEVEIARDTAEGEHSILRMQGELNAPDPLEVVDLVLEVRGFPVQAFGKHTIRAKSAPEGEILCQRHFTVCRARPGSEGRGPKAE